VFECSQGQAESLLASGCRGPKSVIVGCVLEDGLRRLCGHDQIKLTDQPNVELMNAELARQGAYSKLVQKRITASARIRNDAAHGNCDKFTEADVEEMVRYVRSFLEAHIS